MRSQPVSVLVALLPLVFVACEDDKKESLISKTAGEAAAPIATTPPPPPSTSASAAPSASSSADMKRFDPKYKCPTGQTHFYLEGDFCRRKCFTNGDCSK